MRQGLPAVRHGDSSNRCRYLGKFPLGRQGHGPLSQSLTDKPMTVLPMPRNGHKKPTGNDLPRVIGDPGDFQVEGTLHRSWGQSVDEFQ